MRCPARAIPTCRRCADAGQFSDAVLLGFARREQGLLLAPGNPLRLGSMADVVRQQARIAVRPKGAGAQLLLLSLLTRPTSVRAAQRGCAARPTGPDIAQAIRANRADCGIATRAVATGLDFVPLTWERFDLAIRYRDYFRPPLQGFLRFVATPAFAARARELGGYDVADAGQVRSAP